ncbi:hypothetical protein BOTCAL_1630g00010 [Botryotinia calthae]|uniref:DUF6606 domain-containing protein n=1 Tax=Botryotinia calthae TaxID=38488 RepID=A0A4Y8CB38_9HELO|nr:hypothetical protein BOTCAL_1630g00010 [Botryotinia calthae]
MLRKMIESRDSCGDIISERLETYLAKMRDGDALAFHIRCQSARVIICKFLEKVSFESFELLPTAESVSKTKGRLRRCFPGPSIAVGLDKIANSSFCEALGRLLTSLDIDTPNEPWPVVTKAKSQAIEVRDTIHPRFVTEMLTGILRGVVNLLILFESTNAPAILFEKRVVDIAITKEVINAAATSGQEKVLYIFDRYKKIQLS